MTAHSPAIVDEAPTVSMIGPVAVAVLTAGEALARIETMLEATGERIIAFCNAHSVNLARRDSGLRAAYRRALVLNDGVGLDIARKILVGDEFPDNLAGTDFVPSLLRHLKSPRKLYLVGSKPGVAETAADALLELAPQHEIVGVRDGYFANEHGEAVAMQIAQHQPDIVLVGMGQPRQEIWAADHAARTGALVICVGAYLDFVAGAFPRAPGFVRVMRAEWLFRLILEPRRLFKRYIVGNPQFLIGVIRDRRRINSR